MISDQRIFIERIQKGRKKKKKKKENLYTGCIDFIASKVLEGRLPKFLSCPQGNNPFWDHVGARMELYIEYSDYGQVYLRDIPEVHSGWVKTSTQRSMTLQSDTLRLGDTSSKNKTKKLPPLCLHIYFASASALIL